MARVPEVRWTHGGRCLLLAAATALLAWPAPSVPESRSAGGVPSETSLAASLFPAATPNGLRLDVVSERPIVAAAASLDHGPWQPMRAAGPGWILDGVPAATARFLVVGADGSRLVGSEVKWPPPVASKTLVFIPDARAGLLGVAVSSVRVVAVAALFDDGMRAEMDRGAAGDPVPMPGEWTHWKTLGPGHPGIVRFEARMQDGAVQGSGPFAWPPRPD